MNNSETQGILGTTQSKEHNTDNNKQ